MNFLPAIDVRTTYNFMSSLISIDEYLEFAKKNNLKNLFYAELNSMYGVAEFFKKAKKINIKPFVGLTVNFEEYGFHLNIFSKNRNGFEILSNFSSLILTNKIKTDSEKLEFVFNNFSHDLAVVINFKKEISENLFFKIKNTLGDENLFLGLNENNFIDYNEKFIKYEKNILFSKIINYIEKKDFKIFKTAIAVRENCLLSDLENINESYYYDNDLISKYLEIKIHENNLLKLQSLLNFELLDYNKKHLSKFSTPYNIPSKNYLKKIVDENFNTYSKKFKLSTSIDNYKKRIDYELNIISKMNFEDYFLIVHDYVKNAKLNNIYVGPGRGSAAGSIVAFLLNITTVDPLKYNLYFERFLNPDRVTMPDIDIDFQDDRREEVIEYIFEKYGSDKVATITTFSTIGIKGAIRDVGRALDVPLNEVNIITKYFNNDENNLNLKNIEIYKDKYPELFKIAQRFVGLIRQTGTHAAGIVISDVELWKVLPIRIGSNGMNQTQFAMEHLEDFGLIKMDILGLRNLSTLHQIVDMVKTSRNEIINLRTIPLDDFNTFKILREGKTSGIFQLESPGMTNTVMRMQVSNIEDISAASALFRPGPQENIPTYIKNKNNIQEVKYINNDLKNILVETNGIIIYQEQVMEIFKKVANLSLSQADIIRRAISKKDEILMQQYKEIFISGALNNNYKKEVALNIWHLIERFANYGFNKSHSIAYSFISYYLAYFKTNYTQEFFAVMLNGLIGNFKKTQQYIKEAQDFGIKIIPPTIKNTNYNYIGTSIGLYLPLTIIKNIPINFVKKLSEVYKSDKDIFKSMFKFVAAMYTNGLTKEIFISLASVNAFGFYGWPRKMLVKNADEILNYAEVYKNVKDIPAFSEPSLEEVSDDFDTISEWEKEYLGFYLETDPITKYRNEYSDKNSITLIKNISEVGSQLKILVSIDEYRKHIDSKKREMAFITVHDDTSETNISVFSNVLEKYKDLLYPKAILVLLVKVDKWNDKLNLSLVSVVKRIH